MGLYSAVDFIPTVAFFVGTTVPLSVLAVLLTIFLSARKRPQTGAHWTEVARWRYPIRARTTMLVWVLSLFCGIWAALKSSLPTPKLAVGVACFFVSFLILRFVTRRRLLALGFPKGAGVGKYVLLMYGHLLPVAVGVLLAPNTLGFPLIITQLVVVSLVVLMFRNATKIAERIGFLTDPSERLSRLVKSVSDEFGKEMPDVRLLHVWFANAYAVFARYQILFTPAAVAQLNDEEIRAVVAHEMGHLNEPKKLKYRRFVGLILVVPLVNLQWYANDNFWLGIASFVFAFAVILVSKRASVKFEEEADAFAAKLEQDPKIYARGLEKLYEFNVAPAVLGKQKRSHPDLYDRMMAAGLEPDWPRPEPPSRGRLLALLILPWIVGFLFAFYFAEQLLNDELHFRILGDDYAYVEYALSLQENDPNDERAVQAARLSVKNSSRVGVLERAAIVFVAAGECEDAKSLEGMTEQFNVYVRRSCP